MDCIYWILFQLHFLLPQALQHIPPIKDAQMLTEYAEEAKELGNSEIASYFASRAKNRMTTAQDLDRHIESLSRELNMSDGDDGGENPHEMYRKVYRECQGEQCEFLKKKLEKIM